MLIDRIISTVMDNYTEALKVLTLLKLCNCKKGCKDRCSCKAIGLKCTELYFYNGQCWKHCCVLESAFYKFNFLITVNDIVKHQLTKTCSKLAIEASEKLGNLPRHFWTIPFSRTFVEHILVSWKIITVKNPVAIYMAIFGSYICYRSHMNV